MLNPCFVQELETPQWRSTDGGHFLRFLCLLSNILFPFLWKPHILRHFLSFTFYSLGPPWSLECDPGPLYQLHMKFIFLVQVSPAPDSLWMEEAGVICIKARKRDPERPLMSRKGSSNTRSRCVMFQTSQGERAVVIILVLPVSETGLPKAVKWPLGPLQERGDSSSLYWIDHYNDKQTFTIVGFLNDSHLYFKKYMSCSFLNHTHILY